MFICADLPSGWIDNSTCYSCSVAGQRKEARLSQSDCDSVSGRPTRGQPLTAAGLRRIFRYHREITGITAAHPHALRHTFGTALARAARPRTRPHAQEPGPGPGLL